MNANLLLLTHAALTGASRLPGEDKIKVTPMSRILMDGALYASSDKEIFKDSLAIPDACVGVKMSYG